MPNITVFNLVVAHMDMMPHVSKKKQFGRQNQSQHFTEDIYESDKEKEMRAFKNNGLTRFENKDFAITY